MMRHKLFYLAIATAGFVLSTQIFGETNNSQSSTPNDTSIVVDDTLQSLSWVQENRDYVKPPEEELRKMLAPLQYDVTQKDATEPPFQNKYWNYKKEGIYVDVISGEPLFSSQDKYRSGTGWPSFTRPISEDAVSEKLDISFFGIRTELRSSLADSHIGHVFQDGPPPARLRYCINSAALRFIPKEKLVAEGYSRLQHLFK